MDRRPDRDVDGPPPPPKGADPPARRWRVSRIGCVVAVVICVIAVTLALVEWLSGLWQGRVPDDIARPLIDLREDPIPVAKTLAGMTGLAGALVFAEYGKCYAVDFAAGQQRPFVFKPFAKTGGDQVRGAYVDPGGTPAVAFVNRFKKFAWKGRWPDRTSVPTYTVEFVGRAATTQTPAWKTLRRLAAGACDCWVAHNQAGRVVLVLLADVKGTVAAIVEIDPATMAVRWIDNGSRGLVCEIGHCDRDRPGVYHKGHVYYVEHRWHTVKRGDTATTYGLPSELVRCSLATGEKVELGHASVLAGMRGRVLYYFTDVSGGMQPLCEFVRWDLSTGRREKLFGVCGYVFGACLSPDGRRVCVSGAMPYRREGIVEGLLNRFSGVAYGFPQAVTLVCTIRGRQAYKVEHAFMGRRAWPIMWRPLVPPPSPTTGPSTPSSQPARPTPWIAPYSR